MSEEKCPQCPNHCSKDNLGCGRGRAYFDGLNNSSPKTINEQIIMDLRKCGHILHHNKDLDVAMMLSSLKDEEKKELHKLLTKVHENIK